MFYLIGYYGSRNQKIQAIYEFYLYTLVGSLLLLGSLILIYLETGIHSMTTLNLITLSFGKQYILFIGIFIGFAVKIPFIPVHLWLPKAHVEAPTTVSIFLAAILLKFGIYGYIRFLLPITPLAIIQFKSLIYTIAIAGAIYTSLICLTLVDMKKIIAYSSVGHMNLAILALFSGTIEGLNVSIYFMISHGLISSG
jgi:NADH:ubiquinone oxidoreductase subunit 4 (subunit M)